MTQGNLAEWKKKVGDSVAPGDQLASIETDKAVMSFDNVGDEGFIARCLVENGAQNVPVGTVVALLVDDKADLKAPEVLAWTPDAAASKPSSPSAPTTPESAPEAVATPAEPAATAPNAGRVIASPLARKTARELGVSLSAVTGTGGGASSRITKADVVKASADPAAKASPPQDAARAVAAPDAPNTKRTPAFSAPSSDDFERIPVTMMRKTIAARLTQSKNVEVPHYYLMQECRADSMLAVVKQLNLKGDGEYKITVNDYLIKAIARANLLVPDCNTHWYGDHMRRYPTVDVSVAVATPTGLITPIVRDAHAKGLVAISNEVKQLAKKAKEGALQPHEYQGGTVSISNMGGMGIDAFTAIINPPQSMILAVGTTVPRPEMTKDEHGQFTMTGKVVSVINFTASFDHRVVDGATGAQWFKHFKDAVENPLSLLL